MESKKIRQGQQRKTRQQPVKAKEGQSSEMTWGRPMKVGCWLRLERGEKGEVKQFLLQPASSPGGRAAYSLTNTFSLPIWTVSEPFGCSLGQLFLMLRQAEVYIAQNKIQ